MTLEDSRLVEVGSFELKGISQPVTIYEALRSAMRRSDRS